MQRICLALALFAGACGSAQSTGANDPNTASSAPGAAPATTTANDDPNAVECHEEKPIGSSVPRRICRSKIDSQMDHQGAQDWHSTAPPSATRGN